ncbi:xaa-Pro aminopeptidase ApepP-like [Mytilus edulis]|uniref:xaa-Pro aminopeptidase ApepP-like n=1 Tax=Mytilus edulis TaxID=6550 RepID=UPI0039F04C71
MTQIVWLLILFSFVTNGHEISQQRFDSIPVESYNIKRENCVTKSVTSSRLSEVRNLFDKYNIDAYIITADDVHMHPGLSNIAKCDKRIQAVSGFSANFGIAVVTRTSAALWTDGRHFRQAEKETDCGWEIYRKGGPEAVTVTDWIIQKLQTIEGEKHVGSAPSYMNAVWWRNFDTVLSPSNIRLLPIDNDLVDQIWTDSRSVRPSKDLNSLDIKYAGRTWQQKVEDVRKEMTKKNVDVLVVTGVDEIAWLFNVRGKDFANKPYFYSFASIDKNSVSLYIIDSKSKLNKVPTDPESKQKLKDHLKTGADGKCTGECVQVMEYDHNQFALNIASLAKKSTGRIWLSYDCNYKLYSVIPKGKVYQAIPPTLYLKGRKNFIERNGMRNSNLLDSVVIVEFFARLEKEILEGIPWTVHQAAEEAIKVRSRSLSLYRDQSFNTLSGSGHRGADFRYHPSAETDHDITTTEIFNQDSGGQYLDGTSDLTRTFHYGNATEHEKEMYTRVLMAHINLSNLKFPIGQTGRAIDAVSREPLWEVGVDYMHETGHGISHNGAVVEGPASISCIEETHMSDVKLDASLFGGDDNQLERLPDSADYPIDEHMCFTTEPGYYEEGYFGIRIENVMIVRKCKQKYNISSHHFLEFETVTFIPYEPKLINYDIMSQSEVDWMNSYHKEVWDKVSPLLKKKNNNIALEWLYKRVQPVSLHHNIHSFYEEDPKIEL